MNFITFSADATNLFPAANSTNGSQLLTEWNLKSRESVLTDPSVEYTIGQSFVHSERDFEVGFVLDEGGVVISPSTLRISEGRGVINGHFVETLTPMTIDLVEANAKLAAQSRPIMKGPLAVGIRTFFATEQTIAGSILVEDSDDMFLGIQMVVLPEDELITPSDSPDDPNKVTADIRLAKFNFHNNAIENLVNLKEKIQYIDADRIGDVSSLVSDKYVTKTGLNSKKIYAFAGKGEDPQTGADTWEDVTDSMIIWDADPTRTPDKPVEQEAIFRSGESIISTDPDINSTYVKIDPLSTYLATPHKPVYGMTEDDGTTPEYYETRYIKLPNADYVLGQPGLVNKEYTNHIKEIATQVSEFRTSLTGKQIYYMPTRYVDTVLPPINDAWDYGDYILVGVDEYYNGGSGDQTMPPSTMYVVLPGQIAVEVDPDNTSIITPYIQFIASIDSDEWGNEPGVPTHDSEGREIEITGVQLDLQTWYQSSGTEVPNTSDPKYYPRFYSTYDVVRAIPYKSETEWCDYFKIRYYKTSEDVNKTPFTDYYYGVTKSGPREWSDTILVTGGTPFATEDIIGGFLNVADNDTDYGYVYLDSTGHLRLLDYDLLRSGTLAYQIGSDITVPSNENYSEIQLYLTEYVNNRVAFPASLDHDRYGSVINIYLTLPESEDLVTLEIAGIDSRFNTAVCLHILGEASSNVSINIVDCEKFIIDPTIYGSPIINIFRTNLYYNPAIFNYIKTCNRDSTYYGNFTGFQDLSVWYEQLAEDDPKLVADGMTITELDSPIISSSINYWKELGSAINDNDYLVALKSITFSGAGDVVDCEILAANNSTDNIDPGDKIVVGDIVIPTGENLIYPIACMTRVLKISGSFTSAYYADDSWYVTDNNFTLQTNAYDPATTTGKLTGTVAFHSVTTLVQSTISQTSIAPWEPDTYHVFSGGAIS